MKETGNLEILKWLDEECGLGIEPRGFGPIDGSNPHHHEVPVDIQPSHDQRIELKVEPADKEEEPEVKIDVPEKIKEIAKEVQAMKLLDSIQNHLKFYASSPSDDMMNKENLVKKIQGMIEELSNMVGSL